MPEWITQIKLINIIVFLSALQILNMSIDSPILQGDNLTRSSVGFNYIDSYVEYLTEVILKYENAIPETVKHHQKELQRHKMNLLICSDDVTFRTVLFFDIFSVKIHFNHYDDYVYKVIKEINASPELCI
jgi:hypothetical protein